MFYQCALTTNLNVNYLTFPLVQFQANGKSFALNLYQTGNKNMFLNARVVVKKVIAVVFLIGMIKVMVIRI